MMRDKHIPKLSISRRALVGGLIAGAGGLLTGCDRLNESKGWEDILNSAETANQKTHRLLAGKQGLAKTFDPSQRSPIFPSNGTHDPDNPEYNAHRAENFANWTVDFNGGVQNPRKFKLDEIQAMPFEDLTTRLDCVEGWSAIGSWRGVKLSHLLEMVKPDAKTNYLVFHCADYYGKLPYYESIDMIDAWHPQTLLCWMLNDEPLPVGNGAPLRMLIPRQLGYKNAKYVMGIEAVSNYGHVHGGNGGYWEDNAGYSWYAGI